MGFNRMSTCGWGMMAGPYRDVHLFRVGTRSRSGCSTQDSGSGRGLGTRKLTASASKAALTSYRPAVVNTLEAEKPP